MKKDFHRSGSAYGKIMERIPQKKHQLCLPFPLLLLLLIISIIVVIIMGIMSSSYTPVHHFPAIWKGFWVSYCS